MANHPIQKSRSQLKPFRDVNPYSRAAQTSLHKDEDMIKFIKNALKRLEQRRYRVKGKEEVLPPPQPADPQPAAPCVETPPPSPAPKETLQKLQEKKVIKPLTEKDVACRDLMDVMESPFLALSKRRTKPISYESPDGSKKVHVSGHRGHFLASIYDWDIVIFVASKMQEIMNKGTDIPPRTMTFPRHEILKAIHKTEGEKQKKDLEKALSRLQLTGIQTNIRNERDHYKASFGFLDGWKYTKRKNDREVRTIEITLSDWLYEGICADKSLLKVDSSYFKLTSALKRFLYRTARKHAGNSEDGWEFSLETLYAKSGSEEVFRNFKSRLKKAVMANDLPEYKMAWKEKKSGVFVTFKNSPTQELDRISKMFEDIGPQEGSLH